mmetsp:Transcript_46297/g.134857  ORF Transcript_46297/g.134857 Transcript_46297/m.134857 type:complete len:202 (-) Transcript_46297:19-624(-)
MESRGSTMSPSMQVSMLKSAIPKASNFMKLPAAEQSPSLFEPCIESTVRMWPSCTSQPNVSGWLPQYRETVCPRLHAKHDAVNALQHLRGAGVSTDDSQPAWTFGCRAQYSSTVMPSWQDMHGAVSSLQQDLLPFPLTWLPFFMRPLRLSTFFGLFFPRPAFLPFLLRLPRRFTPAFRPDSLTSKSLSNSPPACCTPTFAS